mgnify:CR=1 FL=1
MLREVRERDRGLDLEIERSPTDCYRRLMPADPPPRSLVVEPPTSSSYSSEAEISIAALGEKFVHQLLKRNRIRLLPFDRREWFRGAYSTIQRTLRNEFRPLSAEQKMQCVETIFSRIAALRAEQFDADLQALLVELSTEYAISLGHAQKLVSILIKYTFVCCEMREAHVPEPLRVFVQTNKARLPVPVDAIVLGALAIQFPKAFQDIVVKVTSAREVRRSYSAKIQQSSHWVSWSRLSEYRVYESVQVRVRELAVGAMLTPLEFEMRHLWVQ